MSRPSAVVRIGLMSTPVLHVRGVGKDHPNVRLKQVEDRLMDLYRVIELE